jgi:hypothetical protein
VTFFTDKYAKKLKGVTMSLSALRDQIVTTSAGKKDDLPWLKLAKFGDEKSADKSLRHDANVNGITGIELDYDKMKMTFDEAVRVIEAAHLYALLYTTPSHTNEQPKWRILLPTSSELPPTERAQLVARVNGLFGGIFDPASFTLSQSYLFGSVNGNKAHRAKIVDGDFVDLRPDLDAGAMHKNTAPKKSNGTTASRGWATPLKKIIEGNDLHDSTRDLSAMLVTAGTNPGAAVNVVRDIMEQSLAPRDERFQERYEDIPRLVDSAQKFAPEPVENPGLGVCDAGDDTEKPPPRGWLLGNVFARKFMSSLLAEGGGGKTAYRYAQALALASGRPLTGEHIFQRSRVLIISLEDDVDELRRRILAARLHHNVDLSEVKGWLFYSAPGGKASKLLTTDRGGRAVRGLLAANIEAEIVANKIDLVIIDPFVKSHSVEENLNSVIDDVVQILTDLADKHNIGIDSPHHTSKGPADPGNANRGRGASAMKDAGRLVYTLTPMSVDEAKLFDINPDDRRQFVRIDSGKVNITKHFPAAKWFRLVGVALGNATDLYPAGDDVQTVEPWQPPNVMAGVTPAEFEKVAAAIQAGKWRKSSQAADWVGHAVAEALDLDLGDDRDRTKVRSLVRAWLKARTLVVVKRQNERYVEKEFVEVPANE